MVLPCFAPAGCFGNAAAYSNLSYGGNANANSASARNLTASTTTPSTLAANRFAIVSIIIANSSALSSITINGLVPILVVDNAGASSPYVYQGMYICNVGTTDNALHNGGVDVKVTQASLGSLNIQVDAFFVYMASGTPHSTVENTHGSASAVVLNGCSIPANGFAIACGNLAGNNSLSSISASPTNPSYAVQGGNKTSALATSTPAVASQNLTFNWIGGPANGQTALFASWNGRGT